MIIVTMVTVIIVIIKYDGDTWGGLERPSRVVSLPANKPWNQSGLGRIHYSDKFETNKMSINKQDKLLVKNIARGH